MNVKEQTFFFKRLAYLTNAGIPLSEALSVLRGQTQSKSLGRVYDQLLADLHEGKSFSRALSRFPKTFSPFCVSIVQVGERSGSLPTALEHLAKELKKKQQLRAKVVSALIYPAVITLATIGIMVFLLLFLFPKITPIFKSLHAGLPFSTRVVMGTSTFLGHYWFVLGLVLVLTVVIFTVANKRSVYFRLATDRTTLRLPLLGTMLSSYSLSNISRTLGLLLKSGVTLVEALTVTGEATTNLAYQHECTSVGNSIVQGGRLSESFAYRPAYFPQSFCHLVAVGEKSGTLSDTLLYLAEMYDAEVDEWTKNLSTLIEPVLMVVMGVLVGFIAISIITPIYGITQNLHT